MVARLSKYRFVMSAIYGLSFGFSINKVYNLKTSRDEACLTIGPRTIHATFVTEPVAMDFANLKRHRFKRNQVVLSGEGERVVITVKALAKALNITNKALESFWGESNSIDIRYLKELALFSDVERIDQSCFDKLSPLTPHNATVRSYIAKKLIERGRGGAVADNLEKFGCYDTSDEKQALATLLIERGLGRTVANNLKKFSYDMSDQKQALATLLIEKGEGRAVANNLENFGYTEAMATLLIDKGLGGVVLDKREYFISQAEEGFVLKMIPVAMEKNHSCLSKLVENLDVENLLRLLRKVDQEKKIILFRTISFVQLRGIWFSLTEEEKVSSPQEVKIRLYVYECVVNRESIKSSQVFNEIPPPSEKVDIARFMKLAQRLNFDRPDKEGYIGKDPSKTPKEVKRIFLEKMKVLKRFIDKVKNKDTKYDPTAIALRENSRSAYNNLNNVLANVYLLIKDKSPAEQASYLLQLSRVGEGCLARNLPGALKIFGELTGNEALLTSIDSFDVQVMVELESLRAELYEEVINTFPRGYLDDAHDQLYLKRKSGLSEATIFDDFDDPHLSSFKEELRESFLQRFRERYTPELLISRLMSKFNSEDTVEVGGVQRRWSALVREWFVKFSLTVKLTDQDEKDIANELLCEKFELKLTEEQKKDVEDYLAVRARERTMPYFQAFGELFGVNTTRRHEQAKSGEIKITPEEEAQIEQYLKINLDKSYLDAIVSVFEIDPSDVKKKKEDVSKRLFLNRVYNIKEDEEGDQLLLDPMFSLGEVHPDGIIQLLRTMKVFVS